ncbi:MAG: hypothetical protein K0V04_29030 [Deltaproteobacteria bacterium]|nr:hypothetical protein [Deltaproteobacteria bacterium]
MNKKELTLSDLRNVRGAAAGIFGKKKVKSENVTGTEKHVCDCSSESPSADSPSSAPSADAG